MTGARHTLTRLVAAAGVAVVSLGAQERPLPQLDAFLAKVRPQLRSDRTLLGQYTYLERRREAGLTKFGKIELGPEKVFQVYPGLRPDDSYRRLIEVGGKPRDPAELARDDQKHQKKVLDELRQRERESPGDREKRLQRDAKEKRDDDATIDDLTRVYAFTLVERQPLDGRSTIVIDFAPRPGAVPATDTGKIMKKAKGRAWFAEDDYELARVRVEMLDDLAIGLFLGKLYKGTTVSYDRRKVNDEVWLPAQVRFNGAGRALVRKFRIDSTIQYSDYRKFSVQADTTFDLPR